MAEPVRLDILSDPVCPWCYIGKTNLDAALAQRPCHGLVIEWHPFQLNPDMPRGGMERKSYLEEKLGGPDAMAAAQERLSAVAEAAGLDIDWSRITRVANTLDAHRLIHWAGLEGRQGEAVTAVFDAYWQRGLDIGDSEVLVTLAGEIGLDPDVIRRLLASDADRDQIASRAAHSRARGVSGVPTFIVAQQHAVSGAQPVDLWLSVIDELAAPA